MEHVAQREIQLYVQDQLGNQRREKIEEHLDACNRCLDVYVETIDNWNFDVSLTADFTENTLAKVNNTNASIQKNTKPVSSYRSKRKRSIAHYFIAAGLTIVLMITGVFQSALEFTDKQNMDEQPSITANLMQKTNNWLDQLKKGDHIE